MAVQAGSAYVDIVAGSTRKLVRGANQGAERAASAATSTFRENVDGRPAGQSFGRGFVRTASAAIGSGLRSALKAVNTASIGAALGIGVLAASGAVSLAAVTSAAVGAAAAVAGIGIAAAAQNAQVKRQFTALGEHIKTSIRDAAGVFVPVLLYLGRKARETFNSILPVLRGLFRALAPVVKRLGGAFLAGLRILAPVFARLARVGSIFLSGVAAALPSFFRRLGDALSGAAGMLRPFARQLGKQLVQGLTAVIVPLLQIVTGLARFTAQHPKLVLLATAIAGVIGVLTVLTAIVTKIVSILSVFASGVGIVAVAVAALVVGLVIAYRRSERFRQIVTRAWNAVKTAVLVAWRGYIRPALRALWRWISTVLIPALQRFWTGTVKPVMTKVGRWIMRTWRTVIRPALVQLWGWIKTKLIPNLRFLWRNVVKPVFTRVGKIIRTSWRYIIKPALRALWWWLSNVIFPVIRFLFNRVVKPVFTAIGKIIGFVWNRVVKPVLKAFGWFLKNGLAPVIEWIYNRVIKPVWDGIGAAIQWAWRNVIRPVFNTIERAIGAVGDAFNAVRDKISSVWDSIVGAFRSAIGTVKRLINDFIGLLNKIPGVSIPTLNVGGSAPRRVYTTPGGQKFFAGGGDVPGSGNSDTVPAMLTPGEFVLSKPAVKALGGIGPVSAMHDRARGRGYHEGGPVRHFADGGWVPGWVPDWMTSWIPDVSGFFSALTGGIGGIFRSLGKTIATQLLGEVEDQAGGRGLTFARAQAGEPYVWGGVGPHGWDCSGFMSGIANVIMGRRPYNRLFSTHSFSGGNGVAGFVRGLPSPFMIGVDPGSHMAGTVQGVDVESSGSHGVRVGPAARGFSHPMFPYRFGLAGALARAAVPDMLGAEGANADAGAVLPHGGYAVNTSGRPEAVLTNRQWATIRELSDRGDSQRPLVGTLSITVPEGGDVNDGFEEAMFQLRRARRSGVS